jgi:hypothetical protein
VVTYIAIAGIFAGGYLNQKLESEKLKKGFGWFVLVMGIYIIVKEIFFIALSDPCHQSIDCLKKQKSQLANAATFRQAQGDTIRTGFLKFYNVKSCRINTFNLLLASFILFSCKQAFYKNQDTLKSITAKVDKVEIFLYSGSDTLKTITTDKKKIDIICNLIDGKIDSELKQCNPSGNIHFFSNNNIIFESFFSIGNGCEQLSYFLGPQHYNTKLTYRAGMLLSESDYKKKCLTLVIE